jgi:hypothetical protein
LCLEEPAAAISPPGLAPVAKQSRNRMNVQAADWDESRPANVVQTPVWAERDVLRHLPADVVEDVLAAQ